MLISFLQGLLLCYLPFPKVATAHQDGYHFMNQHHLDLLIEGVTKASIHLDLKTTTIELIKFFAEIPIKDLSQVCVVLHFTSVKETRSLGHNLILMTPYRLLKITPLFSF